MTKHTIGIVSIIPVPLILLLVYLTGGGISPHFPGKRHTWNVQYLLPFSVAMIPIVMLAISDLLPEDWKEMVLGCHPLELCLGCIVPLGNDSFMGREVLERARVAGGII